MKEITIKAHLPDGTLREIGKLNCFTSRVHVEADEQLLPGATGYWPFDALPEVLNDMLPDSFGMKVLQLSLGKRPSHALEVLLTTSDQYRLGAMRFYDEHGIVGGDDPVSIHASIPAVAQQLDALVEEGRTLDHAVVKFLAGISGSAGGARPKFMTEIEGKPVIVKLPKSDDVRNVSLMEHEALTRFNTLDAPTAATRTVTLNRHHALIVERFDRTENGRVPMISGRTAASLIEPREVGETNASWEERISYEHLALFLQEYSHTAEIEMINLFKLAVYNAVIGNTDNHLKNHAFLWDEHIGWQLAPAYDLVPQGGTFHKLAFFFERGEPVKRLDTFEKKVELGHRFDIPANTIFETVEAVEHLCEPRKSNKKDCPRSFSP